MSGVSINRARLCTGMLSELVNGLPDARHGLSVGKRLGADTQHARQGLAAAIAAIWRFDGGQFTLDVVLQPQRLGRRVAVAAS